MLCPCTRIAGSESPPAVLSAAAATLSTVSSSCGRPITCRPTGSPSRSPIGTDTAGPSSWLNGIAQESRAGRVRRRSPRIVTSSASIGGASTGTVGASSASRPSIAAANSPVKRRRWRWARR